MEQAPLTLAHTHARNAALETKRSNPVAASEEHDLAAAEFAAAAQGSCDTEALRILNLLEQHHKKLGQILKSRHEHPTTEEVVTVSSNTLSTTTNTSQAVAPGANRPSSPESTTQPPRLSRGARPTARDLSSSIASNLASARGIPNHRQKRVGPVSPLVSNQHAGGQFSQDETTRKSSSSHSLALGDEKSARPPWAPPVFTGDGTEQGQRTHDSPVPPSGDVPFQQFYSTFENLLSRLSAPLAFAGLPLTSPATQKPPSAPPSQPTPKSAKAPSQVTTPGQPAVSLDYSQLISSAALRAVREGLPSGGNPSESFYVVPTTGGTLSYAEMINRTDRHHPQHARNLSNLSADDFVDAPSTFLSSSATGTIQPRPGSRGQSRSGAAVNQLEKVNGKTMEELALENTALKHLSDTLAKRLHVFEMSAQTTSAALAQSIRSLHLSPQTTPQNSRGKTISGPIVDESDRIKELEDILRKSDARARRREEENVKLRDTLVKYREKWESLKAGAKARREGQREPGATGPASAGNEQSKDRDAKRDKDRDRERRSKAKTDEGRAEVAESSVPPSSVV